MLKVNYFAFNLFIIASTAFSTTFCRAPSMSFSLHPSNPFRSLPEPEPGRVNKPLLWIGLPSTCEDRSKQRKTAHKQMVENRMAKLHLGVLFFTLSTLLKFCATSQLQLGRLPTSGFVDTYFQLRLKSHCSLEYTNRIHS